MRTRVSDSISEYHVSSFEYGAGSTEIHVIRLDFPAQPDSVLPTEVADDAPILDATRARETNISAQRECDLTIRCSIYPAYPLKLSKFSNSHGGGKRCKMDGCHKSAVGGSLYCTGHGGGKRCSVPGCDKSAQSSTNFCVKHGGGKKCQYDGCMKVARGKTLFCAAVSNAPSTADVLSTV